MFPVEFKRACFFCVGSLQYTVHTKSVPFDSDNEVSPYSLSPLSNKRYEMSRTPQLLRLVVFSALICSFDCFVVTSCSAHLANQHGRSPRSPSKCWMLRSCRMISTSTWWTGRRGTCSVLAWEPACTFGVPAPAR